MSVFAVDHPPPLPPTYLADGNIHQEKSLSLKREDPPTGSKTPNPSITQLSRACLDSPLRRVYRPILDAAKHIIILVNETLLKSMIRCNLAPFQNWRGGVGPPVGLLEQ